MPIFTVPAVACPEADVVADALASAAARTAAAATSLRGRAIAKTSRVGQSDQRTRGMLTQVGCNLSEYCLLDAAAVWAVRSAVV